MPGVECSISIIDTQRFYNQLSASCATQYLRFATWPKWCNACCAENTSAKRLSNFGDNVASSMGIFRKAANKLHIKSSSGRHSSAGRLKHDYESEPANEEDAAIPKTDQNSNSPDPTSAQAQVQDAQRPVVHDKSKAGPARLDLEHAPKAPPWAKKGMEANTTYELHGADADGDGAVQQQPAGGQAAAGGAGATASVSQAQRDQQAASVVPADATKQSPAKQFSGTMLELKFVGQMLLLAWIFLTLIYIQLFRIGLLAMILPFLLFGMPIGLGLSWLFFYQLGAKKNISAQVNPVELDNGELRAAMILTQMFVLLSYHADHLCTTINSACFVAVEYYTWSERSCSAHGRCAVMDQLPG